MPKVPKITVEKLAKMTQREFTNVHEEMAVGFATVRREISTKADKTDLLETEERLLHAIKGIEVRKADFDGLADEVKDLARRVHQLEKRH
jgi:polyhydroxyalkanoate synthesis regulator phasin